MSIAFRSVSSASLVGGLPDPVTGSSYVTLPQPDGLAVGDTMITIGASPTDSSSLGMIPVGTGWTTLPFISFFGACWISYKIATADDIAAPVLQFGPSTDISCNVIWLAYSGDIKTLTPTIAAIAPASEGVPVDGPRPVARVDAVGVTVFYAETILGTGGGDPGGVSPNARASCSAWFATVDANTPAIAVGDETVLATEMPTAEFVPGEFIVEALGIVLMLEGNHPPNTPTVFSPPSSGATYTTIEDIPLQLTPFTDIDPGDSASACGFQYELVSGGTWAPITGDPATGTGVIPAGTLTADSWQVEGNWTDQSAATSDWSAARTFTVIDPPATPAITTPASAATITAPTAAIGWTVTDQDAYQWRVIGDVSGSPDPTTVYSDSGLVNDSGARTATASFPVDDVAAHLQLRVIYGGYYSDWYDVPVTVAYTLPDKPVITAITEIPNDAAITVDYTCALDSIPSDATSVALWASQDDFATSFLAVTKTDLGDPLPVAAGTAPWYLPASGVDYSFKIRATNAYGAINDSDPDGSTTGTAGDLRTIIICGGGA